MVTVKKAILLCAGRGSRLGLRTHSLPKPLVEVNGTSMLATTVEALTAAGYTDLVAVVGYQSDLITSALRELKGELRVEVIHSDKWASTNNIYSLWLAREHLRNDITLLEGDIVFDASLLSDLEKVHADCVIAASPLSEMLEGTCVKVTDDGEVFDFVSTKSHTAECLEGALKTVNVYRLSRSFNEFLVPILDQHIANGDVSSYYESTFPHALAAGYSMRIAKVPTDAWYEVDTYYDLSIAEYITSDNRYKHITSKHGGYWRYPVLDFSLIYNFHFPPFAFKEKIKSRFDSILLNYPSCAENILSHLSEFLGVSSESLVVANGVSELIKILPEIIGNTALIPSPSFNEYAGCFGPGRAFAFPLENRAEFGIDVDRLVDAAHLRQAGSIILISPNNPTGIAIDGNAIRKIHNRTAALGSLIVVDESFLDFSSEGESRSFMNVLQDYPRILVLKSMSKTFGIGGLRLGYAACADKDLVDALRARCPIWNINGFAEEFLLHLPLFKDDYWASCKVVRDETDELWRCLAAIEHIRPYPTEANFILCEIDHPTITSELLSQRLIERHGILIKNCSAKNFGDGRHYIRVSSRNREDNRKLVTALTIELCGVPPGIAFSRALADESDAVIV